MITIKESTYDDIKDIQRLWADEDVMKYIWPGGLRETHEAVREWLDRFISARPEQNHYSIFEDGKYCGETQYRIDDETKNASLDIKLFEFARGRGIATQALLYSIQEAFKQGAENLWVDPHPSNVKAINLYRKLGFIQKEMPEYVIALGEDPSLYTYMEMDKKEFNDIKKGTIMNKIEIVDLPKEQWKGAVIPLITKSDSYYDFEIKQLDKDGCKIELIKRKASDEIVHTPEEYDFPDSLYQDHWENAEAFGVVGDNNELLACIEVCPEEWSNRLMVTELWVSDNLRGKGLGKQLMDKAKEVAQKQKRRAIMLETQSCNTNAIGFYLHEGFELIGFDTCCYTNNDIGRREVRINLGFFFNRDRKRW